jgi:hypothetical protein
MRSCLASAEPNKQFDNLRQSLAILEGSGDGARNVTSLEINVSVSATTFLPSFLLQIFKNAASFDFVL